MQFEVVVQRIQYKRLTITVDDESGLDELVDEIEAEEVNFEDLDAPIELEEISVTETFEIEE